MQVTRLWALVSVLIVVAAGALGYFLGVQPQLSAAASANEQRQGVESQNAIQQITIATLKAEFENLPGLRAGLDEARLSVPAQAEYSTFLQQLSELASLSSVTVVSFSTQEALSFVAPADSAEAIPAELTGDQFIVIPVDIEVSGTREQVLDFVERVQTGPRLVLIDNLRVDRVDGDGVAVGLLSGLIYVLLDEPGGILEEDAPPDPLEASTNG